MGKILFACCFAAVMCIVNPTCVCAGNSLSDISEHWAREHIQELVDKNAISGYPDGTFKPENNISRAEFIKILICALGTNPGNHPTDYWAASYIDESISKGYLSKGEFDDFDKSITRGEIAKLVTRTMNEAYPENLFEYSDQIKDYDSTLSYYQFDVLRCYAAGIVTGFPDGTFGYDRTATRAEASAMIVRRLDISKRILPILPGPESSQRDSDFIEPDITVEYNTNPYVPTYFTIKISNYEDYNDDYQFKIDFTNYPQLNEIEYRWAGTWTKVVMNDWKAAEYVKMKEGEIYRLSKSNYTTRENKETFQVISDMSIEYVTRVKNSDTERFYIGKVTVNNIEFK